MFAKECILFTSSLRHRAIWSVLHPVLAAAPENALEESPADTYDLAFHSLDEKRHSCNELRTILATPFCLEEANRQATLTRVEEFVALQNAGDNSLNIAIIFLHSDKVFQTASGRCNVDGLISLQTLLFHSKPASNLPIISATEPSALLASVKEHRNSLARDPIQHPSLSSRSSLFLLEHVVSSGRPSQLPPRHNLNILSDLFPSLRELSRAVRTPQGRQLIIDNLEPDVAESILAFWDEEYICG